MADSVVHSHKLRRFGMWILITCVFLVFNACTAIEKSIVYHPKIKPKSKLAKPLFPSPRDNDAKYYYPPDADADDADEDNVESNPPHEIVCEKKENMPDNWDYYMKYFEKLGICLDGSENEELLSVLVRWIGVPYRIGGCSMNGIDCSCLVRTIYRDVYGIELNRTSQSIFIEDTIPLEKEDLQEGDIVVFITRKKRISHVGIYLKDDMFVHATRAKGVVIDSLNDPYYQKTYYSAGRVKDKTKYKLTMNE